jgi:hypothetical protein
VVVVLDREGLESSLVQVAGAAGLVVRVVPHRVHDRQAPKEFADLFAVVWSHDEVPMVRHQDHGEYRQGDHLPGLVNHLQKGVVIFRLFKDGEPGYRTVENVKHCPLRTKSNSSRHRFSCLPTTPEQAFSPRPLFLRLDCGNSSRVRQMLASWLVHGRCEWRIAEVAYSGQISFPVTAWWVDRPKISAHLNLLVCIFV